MVYINISFICLLWLLTACGDLLNHQHQLAVSRQQTQLSSHQELLWQEVSLNEFCLAIHCSEWVSPAKRKIIEKLQSTISTLHKLLGIDGIPEPELVVVKNQKSMKNPNLRSFSLRQQPRFFLYLAKNTYPIRIKKFHNGSSKAKKSDPSVVILGLHQLSRQSLDSHSMMEKITMGDYPNLPNDPSVSSEKIATLLNHTFQRSFQFLPSPVPDTILFKDVRLSQETSNNTKPFNWIADRIYLERKTNKIIFSSNEQLSFDTLHSSLLLELLENLYDYYQVDLRSTGPSSLMRSKQIPMITDTKNSRKSGDMGNIIAMLDQDFFKQLFKDDYYPKRHGLLFSPEIFDLLFYLEIYTAMFLDELPPDLKTLDSDVLFSKTPNAQKLFAELTQTPEWELYEQILITKQKQSPFSMQFLSQPIIIYKMISSFYDQVSTDFLQHLERELVQFYATRSLLLPGWLDERQVTTLIKNFFNGGFLATNNQLIEGIVGWLTIKKSRGFSYHINQFSLIIEHQKSIMADRKAELIKNQAYPYTDTLKKDETIVHYLSLLGINHQLYMNYLLQELTPTQKARCLYNVSYHENLLDFYTPYYHLITDSSPDFTCFRAINVAKEHLRHQ
ncbi:MAG: hypothetical protein OXC40_02105 [Proteobacteria bacterium]|nr:hypothetical protein [Pseudomonadota bacterium]